MTNCEHLLNKRTYNRETIASHLLMCPNCDEKHTVGYQDCEARIKYKDNQAKRALRQQQRYIDAPKPSFNPWSKRPTTKQSSRPTINQHIGNSQYNNAPVVFNNPNYTQPQINSQHHPINNNNNTNIQSDKFSPAEVLQLLNQIITCIDTCNTRAEQFKVMTNILSQHFIR